MKNSASILFSVMFSILFAISAIASTLNDPNPEAAPVSPPPAMKKVIVGGDIGATFGNYTEVRISPMVGYRFSKYVSGGIKGTYRHSWNKISQNTPNEATIQTNSFGGSAFLQYNPIPNGYLSAEYSYQVYKNSTTQNTDKNTGVNFLFLGLGYTTVVAPNVFLNAGIKVDVLNDSNSPFENFTPFFDVGIAAGI